MAIISHYAGMPRIDIGPEVREKFNGVITAVFKNGELKDVQKISDPAPVIVKEKKEGKK